MLSANLPAHVLYDLRWDSLLGCGSRVLGLSLSDPKMLDFCDKMVLNNPKTGNFGLLLTLTVAAIDEVGVREQALCRRCGECVNLCWKYETVPDRVHEGHTALTLSACRASSNSYIGADTAAARFTFAAMHRP